MRAKWGAHFALAEQIRGLEGRRGKRRDGARGVQGWNYGGKERSGDGGDRERRRRTGRDRKGGERRCWQSRAFALVDLNTRPRSDAESSSPSARGP